MRVQVARFISKGKSLLMFTWANQYPFWSHKMSHPIKDCYIFGSGHTKRVTQLKIVTFLDLVVMHSLFSLQQATLYQGFWSISCRPNFEKA
ncbi:hypothetical protein CR513_04405, partial [Mucuna pruriens]